MVPLLYRGAREVGAGQPGRRPVPVDSQYYQAEQAQPGHEAEQLNRELCAIRDAEGRWQKGVSGNPAGRAARVTQPGDADGGSIA